MKKTLFIVFLFLLSTLSLHAQQAMNRPYADDKLIHFGFSLSVNFMSFMTPETLDPQSGMYQKGEGYQFFAYETLHARCPFMLPGFSVGFITDLRLARYLSLRFTPQMHFGQRTISYKSESGRIDNLQTEVLSLPISVPLELKWAAEREGNYRPYVVFGGGLSYNCGIDKDKPIALEPLDFFIQAGAGCDFYFRWFKLCPEIKYQIGLKNILTPADERSELQEQSAFYTNALRSLRSQMITIVFNFE